MFFPVEATAGHQKLIDDWCRQDIGTGVCGRSAWLLQQSAIGCQRGPLPTFAECTECGGKTHHWCKKIRSHLSCVAWSPLVTSATKDNLQDRHFDAPVLERFGTLLPGDRLYRNLVDARPETVTICSIRTAIHSKNQDYDIWTKVVQVLWSHNLGWSACQIEGFFSEQKLSQKIASNIFICYMFISKLNNVLRFTTDSPIATWSRNCLIFFFNLQVRFEVLIGYEQYIWIACVLGLNQIFLCFPSIKCCLQCHLDSGSRANITGIDFVSPEIN